MSFRNGLQGAAILLLASTMAISLRQFPPTPTGFDSNSNSMEILLPHHFYKPRFRLTKNNTIHPNYNFVVGQEYVGRRHNDFMVSLNDTRFYNDHGSILFVVFTTDGVTPDLPSDVNYVVYNTDVLLFGFTFLFLNTQFAQRNLLLVYHNFDCSLRRLDEVKLSCTLKNTLYYVSRTEMDMPCQLLMKGGSNDVYIFQSDIALNSAFRLLNYQMDYWGVETMFAYVLRDNTSFDVVNLCGYIDSIHFQQESSRPADVGLGKRYRIDHSSNSLSIVGNSLLDQKCNFSKVSHGLI
jgi:hypothetical protein